MKIEIKYPKIVNLYSFISNLSQWNELICVPQRKKEWLRQTGKLNEKEKRALGEFGEIFQKAEINLEPIFLFENPEKIWSLLSKKIGKNKLTKIQSIFKILDHRFNKIWAEENKKLRKIAHEFIAKKPSINNKLKPMRKLCGLRKDQLPKKITLKLLLSSASKEDCQAWSFKEIVILECSGWPIKKIGYLINNIFLHECFHILLKKNKKLLVVFESIIKRNQRLLNNTKLEIWTPEVIFEEALISSFLPEGYLSEKYLKIDSKKIAAQEFVKKENDDFTKLRYFCALNLYNSAKEYIEKNKTLDKVYFEKVKNCLFDFIKNKRG